jgi:serine/threonine protein kinase
MGRDLDARSDLFSVGTLLYLLTTGRKPFDGDSDADVLMQVRNARYEKPSAVVKDFNPDVERFIVRALRADPARRWQSAEQMANRLDAIRVKLGQHAGPAALKRWLENLSAKDGVIAPADLVDPPDPGTIELGSRDLELEDVAGPTDTERDPPPTRPERPTPVPRARRQASVAADADAPIPTPAVVIRAGRWLRRTFLRALALATVLAAGGYFARSYLPARLVEPVKTWLQQLPSPLGSGRPSPR